MKTVKVAILGLGTVGSGVYKLIQKRADVMEKTIGAQMEVKKILVRNINKKREGVDASLLTDNWNDIVEDDEIQIVIEVMGGMEPAKTMILEALRAGKNVVSANKDLIAEEGHVLLATAEEHHVDFLFEAAVAGAIPIIRPMKQCLAVNDISEVVGIVNGTTNYILTKMTEEGMDFSDALEKAQELGAKVVTVSDSTGWVYDPEGIDLDAVKEIKEVKRARLTEYKEYRPNSEYHDGVGVWSVKCDVALPCATQNELHLEDAKQLVANGCIAVAEGANMPTTMEATEYLQANDVLFAPGKASNAGGVATSALEMSQNSERLSWSFEEVDEKLNSLGLGLRKFDE